MTGPEVTDPIAAAEAAIADAEQAREQAEAALSDARRQANRRQAELKAVTVESGKTPEQLRELADRVHLTDPADLEDAEIAAAKAQLRAGNARRALAAAQHPALAAEAERLRLIAKDAEQKWRHAHGLALTAFSDARDGWHTRQASERLTAAEKAKTNGARARLASLTGIPTSEADAQRDTAPAGAWR